MWGEVPPLPGPLLRVTEAREKRNGLVRGCGGEEWDGVGASASSPQPSPPSGGGEGEEEWFGARVWR